LGQNGFCGFFQVVLLDGYILQKRIGNFRNKSADNMVLMKYRTGLEEFWDFDQN